MLQLLQFGYVYKRNCNPNLWMQIIKQLVQEPRPFTCNNLEMCDSYGWPSSHSQFMLFFAVYLTLLAIFKFQFSAKYVKDITIGLPWAFAPIVMLSRVYLGYHSVTQVLAGGSLGILLGSAWFWVVHHHFSPNFHKYENSKVCRFFRVKDSSHISDVIGFEYRCSRRARNRHQRAKLIKERERPKYHHHRFCCHRCLRPSRICWGVGKNCPNSGVFHYITEQPTHWLPYHYSALGCCTLLPGILGASCPLYVRSPSQNEQYSAWKLFTMWTWICQLGLPRAQTTENIYQEVWHFACPSACHPADRWISGHESWANYCTSLPFTKRKLTAYVV